MANTLLNYVSRFIVPFYFDYENDGYRKVFEFFKSNPYYDEKIKLPKGRWIEAGFWENYKSKKKMADAKKAEMDVFSYLPEIFKENESIDKSVDSNLGASFVYGTDGKIFEAYYMSGKDENPDELMFECKDVGILLFKNGIGFLWYEVGFRKEIEDGKYVEFLHDFKELARTRSQKIQIKTGFDKENKQSVFESLCIGVWITRILHAQKLGIHFWADRVIDMDGEIMTIPDKALLFQYAFANGFSNDERNNYVFQITNGYDKKYNAPENLESMLFKPFGNSCFYVANAGMGCVVTNDASNETFFSGQFREKYVRDYFFIYLLLLYQSYSCAHYSRLLTLLPADESAFRFDAQNVDRIESLNSSINLFLVKSIFDSVSNVDHQNGVYRYGKEKLCINADISSITAGLEGFGAIERARKNIEERKLKEKESDEKEKRENKVNRAMTVFGFLVVISAVLDGLNLVDWFRTNNLDNIHILVICLILLVAFYLVVEMLLQKEKKVRKDKKRK